MNAIFRTGYEECTPARCGSHIGVVAVKLHLGVLAINAGRRWERKEHLDIVVEISPITMVVTPETSFTDRIAVAVSYTEISPSTT